MLAVGGVDCWAAVVTKEAPAVLEAGFWGVPVTEIKITHDEPIVHMQL